MARAGFARAGALLALLAAVSLTASGCDTTAAKSSRAKIAADRELEGRKPVVVKKPDPHVKVNDVQVVGSGKKAAFVVVLTSSYPEAVADLRINVGVERGGERKILNRGPKIYFFYNHVPAAAPGKQTIWVAPLGKRVPKGKPFAVVGSPTTPQRAKQYVPPLTLEGISAGRKSVSGEIENDSGSPQYIIELYATARDGDRFVAAGRNRAVRLANGERQEFSIPLVGRRGAAKVDVSYGLGALPTK